MHDRPRSASPDLAQSCEGLIYCLSPGLYYNLGQFIPLYGASKLKSHAVARHDQVHPSELGSDLSHW